MSAVVRPTCPDCNGTGRIECVAYYYGVVECSSCGGCGINISALTLDECRELGIEPNME